MSRGDPGDVGVDEEEEDDAEDHEIHVDKEEDAAVIKAPGFLHATDGVGSADCGDEQREDEERGGMVVGESREAEGDCETEKNDRTAANEGARARVEDAGFHTACDSVRRTLLGD